MSKIAIVGCDASGKTVFVSALTEYYKAGQRPGQTCALVAGDGATRKYTDELHHTMRILHQWPKATPVGAVDGVRRLKWTMLKNSRPITEIHLLDYGGENFRYAFRDDGNVRNAAVVETLVKYISEADYIVITVGLDNMVRGLTPEVYQTMENGAEEYNRDSEAQWITTGLLKLVKAKLDTDPPGVLVALTQADKYRDVLKEYGGAKGLFTRCWADVSLMYPNLNVVAISSVDKVTEAGLPAPDYRTDGVLDVMKEFARYTFGNGEEVSTHMNALRKRLCEMDNICAISNYRDAVDQYESALEQLKDNTAVVEELYKDAFVEYERFLPACKLFNEVLVDSENWTPEEQVSQERWAEQLKAFPQMGGTIQGVIRFYERKAEQRKAEELRQEEERRLEEERRQEEERKAAEAEKLRYERELAEKALREKAECEARLAHERELKAQQMREAAEMTKIEYERIARQDRVKNIIIMSVIGVVFLIIGCVAIGYWVSYERDRKAQEEERALAIKQSEAEKAKAEADRIKAQADIAQAAADRAKAESDRVLREKYAEVDKKLVGIKALISDDDLEGARAAVSDLGASSEMSELQKANMEYCRTFCDRLELAKSDDITNLLWIARQHFTGAAMVTADVAKALAWYERAGDKGSLEAMVRAARCWETGMGCERNEGRALFWRGKAAEAGDVPSMMRVAKAASEGNGPDSAAVSAKWYEKAAEAGDVEAMMKFAWCSECGRGVAIDNARALKMYQQAAEKGNGDALYRLGVFYYAGRMGLTQSYEKAREMFVKAKEVGCSYNDPGNGVDSWISAMDRKIKQQSPKR